jgi:CRP-like cAMP-binding protein
MLQALHAPFIGRPSRPAHPLDNEPPLKPLNLPAKAVLFDAHDWGKFYRLVSGIVRFDDDLDGCLQLAGIALPGDLLGAEVLLQGEYRYRARALTPCVIQPLKLRRQDSAESLLLPDMLRQQQRQASLLALRYGTAESRLEGALRLFSTGSWDDRDHGHALDVTLPTLRDLADMTDMSIETASRVLSRLRQQGVLVEVTRRQFHFYRDRYLRQRA